MSRKPLRWNSKNRRKWFLYRDITTWTKRAPALAICILAFVTPGLAEDRVGVAQWNCPWWLLITLKSPQGTLTLNVFMPGGKTRHSSYPAVADYCPVQGDCITGEGSVNFKKSGKKDAAGTYSVEFPSGAKEQSSFRVTLARQGLVICE